MPPTFSQTGRLLSITTPLGPDKLLLERLEGYEALSELFQYTMTALCLKSDAFTFDKLLGQVVTAKVEVPGGAFRYCSGVVCEVEEADPMAGLGQGTTFLRYRLTVVPKAWFLGLGRNSRIFQQLSVPDILKKVLVGLDVSWRLQGTYEPRDYCTQYRESDLAFATRLLEEEGAYFYFKHSDGSHQMVVADTPQGHDALSPASISFQPGEGGLHPDDRIMTWARRQVVRSGKVTLWDQCFELPGQNLEASAPVLASVAAGATTQKLDAASNSSYEWYDYPGAYAQRFDGVAPGGGDRASDVQKIFQDNTRTAGIRMAQETTQAVLIEGDGNVRFLGAGQKFSLTDHFNGNGEYVLTRVKFEGYVGGGAYTAQSAEPASFHSQFQCIPSALPYRPARVAPRPFIPGPQTAVVVGPSGEEIFTDKYGRIKVQFPWDREGKKDQASSCWVRVGTPWAGKQWGMIQVPRIGQEVIVAFEDGDPDRPIAVGSVYNADQMPPYVLPDNKTRSTWKSRSSMKGTEENFNELRFEDKKDSEEIYFHAEKDFNRVVENNDTLKVGFEKKTNGDQTIEIFNIQSVKIGAGKTDCKDGSQTIDIWKNHTLSIGTGKADCKDGSQTVDIFKNQTVSVGTGKSDCKDGSQVLDIFKNQTVSVGTGKGDCGDGSQTVSIYKNRTVTLETGNDSLVVSKGNRAVEITEGNDSYVVKKGNRTVEISTGNDELTVKTGNRTVEVSTGNDSLTVKTGNHTIKVSSGQCSIEAAQSIELKCGGSSIKITPSSITLNAPTVTVQGTAQVSVKAPTTQINGDGMVQIKGGVIMIG